MGTIFALISAGVISMQGDSHWYSNIINNYAPLGIGGIVAPMGLTFIAFEGYEIIVQTGEEVKIRGGIYLEQFSSPLFL